MHHSELNGPIKSVRLDDDSIYVELTVYCVRHLLVNGIPFFKVEFISRFCNWNDVYTLNQLMGVLLDENLRTDACREYCKLG